MQYKSNLRILSVGTPVPVESGDPVNALYKFTCDRSFIPVDALSVSTGLSLVTTVAANTASDAISIGLVFALATVLIHTDLSNFSLAAGTYTIMAPIGSVIAFYYLT